jgi:hypothetical protein
MPLISFIGLSPISSTTSTGTSKRTMMPRQTCSSARSRQNPATTPIVRNLRRLSCQAFHLLVRPSIRLNDSSQFALSSLLHQRRSFDLGLNFMLYSTLHVICTATLCSTPLKPCTKTTVSVKRVAGCLVATMSSRPASPSPSESCSTSLWMEERRPTKEQSQAIAIYLQVRRSCLALWKLP